jgi:type I restriction enzyme S subunit
MLVEVPSLPEQQAITALITSIDDKIELNRRMVVTLEAAARALFKSWFVDFDPVHAKVEGRSTGLPGAIADLFPASFDDDGVPSGWSSTSGAVGELVRSTVGPRDVGPDTPYVGLEHLDRKTLVVSKWGTARDVESAKTKFQKGDLLFGKLRPYFHKVSIAPADGICSSDIFVFRPLAGVPSSFLYLSFSQESFVDSASNASSGTRMPPGRLEIHGAAVGGTSFL